MKGQTRDSNMLRVRMCDIYTVVRYLEILKSAGDAI